MIYKAKVVDGKIEIPVKNKKFYEGKEVYVELTMCDSRTISQNNTFWLRNRMLSKHTGEVIHKLYPPEQIADMVKVFCLGYEEIVIGGYEVKVPASSKKLPMHRFSDLIQFQDLLAIELGVTLPEVVRKHEQ